MAIQFATAVGRRFIEVIGDTYTYFAISLHSLKFQCIDNALQRTLCENNCLFRFIQIFQNFLYSATRVVLESSKFQQKGQTTIDPKST